MAALFNSLMASDTSATIATALGLAVCAFAALVVVFGGDPKPGEPKPDA